MAKYPLIRWFLGTLLRMLIVLALAAVLFGFPVGFLFGFRRSETLRGCVVRIAILSLWYVGACLFMIWFRRFDARQRRRPRPKAAVHRFYLWLQFSDPPRRKPRDARPPQAEEEGRP